MSLKPYIYIKGVLLTLFTAFALVSCDIHEWPDEMPPEVVPLTIHLEFDTSMPIYEEINMANSTRGDVNSIKHDKRYILGVFPHDNQGTLIRIPDTLIVFTKESQEEYDHTLSLNIPEGNYSFLVWTDYVHAKTVKDCYYKTDDFAEIILSDREHHIGNTDYRDAFRGEQSAIILADNPYNEVVSRKAINDITIPLERPMAKYKVIATDLQEFVRYAKRLIAQKAADEENGTRSETRAFDLDDYRVVFRYNGFMPCSFNMFTNKPADAWTGIFYESTLCKLSEDEAELGFDYVFVNGDESSVSITIEVYDWEDDLISRSSPIEIPIIRSHLSVVRGDFLTTKAAGGVGIIPEFDGDYNYVVP